jgi:hypothetical protein
VVVLAAVAALVLASCSAWESIEWPDPPNEAFVARVPADSSPRRTADETAEIILGVFPGDHGGLERPAATESGVPSR